VVGGGGDGVADTDGRREPDARAKPDDAGPEEPRLGGGQEAERQRAVGHAAVSLRK